MRRLVKLITRCGCERRMTSPDLPRRIDVPLRRTFLVSTGIDPVTTPTYDKRTFEYQSGDGMDFLGMAIYVEVDQ